VKQEPVEMNVPLYLDPRSNSRNEVIENVMAGLPMGKVVSFSFNDAFSKFLDKNEIMFLTFCLSSSKNAIDK
jgi:hypothetical protein